MILRIAGFVVNIQVGTMILLTLSVVFLLSGLFAYQQPQYARQTIGFVIPGIIIGTIGLVMLLGHLHDID